MTLSKTSFFTPKNVLSHSKTAQTTHRHSRRCLRRILSLYMYPHFLHTPPIISPNVHRCAKNRVNMRFFLHMVGIFRRWVDIILRYTPISRIYTPIFSEFIHLNIRIYTPISRIYTPISLPKCPPISKKQLKYAVFNTSCV